MTADSGIRAGVGEIPTPEFDSTPVAAAPILAKARVAILTTAGLRGAGDVSYWQPTDGSFTVLPATDRDVQLSHFSPNFDRSGFAADINVVYPVDRLEEMAAAGDFYSTWLTKNFDRGTPNRKRALLLAVSLLSTPASLRIAR